MALNLIFYEIFPPQKVPHLKISDDIIAHDLWFGLPQSKILATSIVALVTYHRLQSHLISWVNFMLGYIFGLRVSASYD